MSSNRIWDTVWRFLRSHNGHGVNGTEAICKESRENKRRKIITAADHRPRRRTSKSPPPPHLPPARRPPPTRTGARAVSLALRLLDAQVSIAFLIEGALELKPSTLAWCGSGAADDRRHQHDDNIWDRRLKVLSETRSV
ncbi:hypothetical protein EVAR_29208_1 [Eumeta japonica]|uniref:Uncharacterized protein n=1 Tax=Eumeta variegata TaxID=151549 RepID=A0A4C1VKL4_EUMVA|nr:hypothetical protein EVAR_29208_1 [Eumeta japonica]